MENGSSLRHPYEHFNRGETLMDFLQQLMRGISFVPALVTGIEGLFGNKSGPEKKDAAMSFLENALAMSDAIAAREIVNPEQFKDGISQIIDGVVRCMNASAWTKSSSQPSAVSPQA
jgi:hypothetical protein